MTQSQYPSDDPHGDMKSEKDFIKDLLRGTFSDRSRTTKELLRYFEYAHLPEPLKGISRRVAYTAIDMVQLLPDGDQLISGLRKLLESKDCFVRAMLPEE